VAALRPYQADGVDFLSARDTAALLDDPGLGKTLQVIAAADALGLSRILVVCPAIGRVSWIKELAKWQKLDRHIFLLRDISKADTSANRSLVVIATFDEVSRKDRAKDLAALSTQGWDLLVIDEAQYLKNTSSNRTRTVYGHGKRPGFCHNVRRTWILSGTLCPNHNGELFPHLNALFPDVLVSLFGKPVDEFTFQETFCRVADTPFGRSIKGSKNTARLREATANVFLRRRKADVLDDLPALDFQDHDLDPEALGPSAKAALDTALRAMLQKAGPVGGIAGKDGNENLLEQWIDANAAHIATERRALGLAKAPLAVMWAEDQLFQGVDKLILFAVHTDVIKHLDLALADHGTVVVTGATHQASRTAAVDKFQSDPECRVFIGQIQAAGTAITLTAASRVGIVEPAWTPAENLQAICRAHRLGQKDGVVATFLRVPGTLDQHIARILRRKTQDLAELFE
jgi:SWI/SNF-related matrix-associated actin-dependent regulator of chromatin subfamily A-like protein 1